MNIRCMKKKNLWMLAAILLCGLLTTACSDDDDPTNLEPATLTKALQGEWISEINVDEFESDNPDVKVEPSADGYVMVFIHHFNDDGTCWKEINVTKDGLLINQPVDRYSTSSCRYSVGKDGLVIVEYENSEEGDELRFDGTRLTEDYGNRKIVLQRATEEQIKLYKEQSDAWHGGAAEKKYDVADYKPKGVDNSRWMKQLNDNRLVADRSLPGSHDACTAEGWSNPYLGFAFELTAKCQDLTINEQLKVGVRVFDLRPEHDLDGKDYVLRCCHGPAGTKMYVSDFFKTLKQFLADNPTEFCVVTIDLSATKKKDAWGKDFNNLVNSAELKSMFADFKARLTVGEMRGKVLMLSKEVYAEKPLGGYCYGWDSYLELEQQKKAHITAADGSETPLWVQDYWKDITRENKSKALVGMLEASVKRDMTAEKPAWVINYPSTKLYNTVGMKLVDAVIKQN